MCGLPLRFGPVEPGLEGLSLLRLDAGLASHFLFLLELGGELGTDHLLGGSCSVAGGSLSEVCVVSLLSTLRLDLRLLGGVCGGGGSRICLGAGSGEWVSGLPQSWGGHWSRRNHHRCVGGRGESRMRTWWTGRCGGRARRDDDGCPAHNRATRLRRKC